MNFIERYPKVKLIIIDTLQKVRKAGRDKFSYADDYEVIGKIKEIGDSHDVTILIIHHTRKEGDNDAINTISGTNGIVGSRRCICTAKGNRMLNRANLVVTGRDGQTITLSLSFQADTCKWELLSHSDNEITTAEDPVTVRYIFGRYTSGIGCYVIAKELIQMGAKTKRGNTEWGDSMVRGIITNEKYKGDVLMQKTLTVDPISKRRLYNFGEEEKYYIANHHEPIISEEQFEQAQKILHKRSKNFNHGRMDKLDTIQDEEKTIVTRINAFRKIFESGKELTEFDPEVFKTVIFANFSFAFLHNDG